MPTVTRDTITDIVEALANYVNETTTWQSNLSEAQRQQCLEWAAKRFTSALQQERTHVLGELRTVNQIMGQHEITRADVIAAILGEA